jgi:hypothetical protein
LTIGALAAWLRGDGDGVRTGAMPSYVPVEVEERQLLIVVSGAAQAATSIAREIVGGAADPPPLPPRD